MKSLEKTLRYITLIGVFVLPFIVFLVDSSQVFPFITGKNFSFRVLVEIIFGAWVGLAFLNETYRPKRSLLLGSVALFVGIMFVANIFGVEPRQSFWSNFERMDGWITLIHLLAYVLVLASVLHTKDLWRKFWNVSVVASVGVGLFAMAQLLQTYLVKTLGKPADEGLASLLPIVNQGGDRLDATFGNATYLAVYMLLHIFITITLLLRYKSISTKMKVFYGCALILQIVSLYYTATRGAILGLIGGVLVSAVLLFFFEARGTKIKRAATWVLVSVVILIGGFFLVKDSAFVQNQNTLHRLASISLQDKTTNSRFIMWDISWKGVQERPLLGYGQGNFNYVFNTYYDPALYDQEQWFDRAHNVVFDWLIAGGFLGLLAYVLIFVALLKMLIQSDQLSRREKIIFIGMISGYIFQNLFVFDQITSYLVFFAFVAYVHSLGGPHVLFQKLFSIEEVTKERIIVPLVIVATILTPFFVNADGYRQSRTAIKAFSIPPSRSVEELNSNVANAENLFKKALDYNAMGTAEIRERLPQTTVQVLQSEQVNNTLKEEFVALTISEFQKQLEETPDDARYHLIYGNFLNTIGSFDEGLVEIERARELSPQKQPIYAELAQTNAYLGNVETMLDIAQKGYEINKENDDMWAIYTLAVQLNGQEDLYKSLLQEALENEQYQRLITLTKTQIRGNQEAIQLRINLAQIYAQAGQMEDAIQTLRAMAADFPEDFPDGAQSLIDQL